jgi:ketopantoate hydroxymethyltransferase
MLTAYDYPGALAAAAADVDVVLVGGEADAAFFGNIAF